MHARLLALLVVAALAGVGAAWTSNPATAVTAAAAARIPPLPRPAASTLRCPIPARFRASFVQAAHDTGLPLAMLVAVAEIESDFRADARSSADARGLLQVLPTTAASLQLDADEPASNVLAGARYLKLLLERFQSADLALAAYNAGPTAVEAAGGAPTSQTLTYVADVTTRWRALTACNGF
jgi:soluble lytic murein transglycosylase-like protein